MVVVAEKLELDPSLKLETRIASAVLEVDMPGTADEPLRSKPAAVAGRVATLGFKHAFAAGAGTNLHAALAAALQSDDQADSEIQLYVYAVDAKGGEKELGMAAVSLEALLEKGADHSLGAVAVKDAKGVEVGQLTVAVTALAALREIDASLESSAVVVELAQLTHSRSRRRRRASAAAPPSSSRSTSSAPTRSGRRGSRRRAPSATRAPARTRSPSSRVSTRRRGARCTRRCSQRCSRTSRPTRRCSSPC